MFTYVFDFFLYILSINFLCFICSFLARLDPSLLPSQLRCPYPRCCPVNSCPMRTSVPLWTRRLFHLTVYWLTLPPLRGSWWAFQTSWWVYKTSWWKIMGWCHARVKFFRNLSFNIEAALDSVILFPISLQVFNHCCGCVPSLYKGKRLLLPTEQA